MAYGASEEIGPFRINRTGSSLYLNKYSWNRGKIYDMKTKPIESFTGLVHNTITYMTYRFIVLNYIKVSLLLLLHLQKRIFSFLNLLLVSVSHIQTQALTLLILGTKGQVKRLKTTSTFLNITTINIFKLQIILTLCYVVVTHSSGCSNLFAPVVIKISSIQIQRILHFRGELCRYIRVS